jgi:hypothetical protein
MYSFLEDTGIKFQIEIHNAPVWVKVWYLNPETFKTCPMFFLSTDVPENDHLSKQFLINYTMPTNLQNWLSTFFLAKEAQSFWMR